MASPPGEADSVALPERPPTLNTYVADTHSLVWYLGTPARLGPLARDAFAEAASGRARVIIPVIVLAEIIFAVERGRIRADVRQIIRRIRSVAYLRVSPLRLATILRLQTLRQIPEMHDRILVAETLVRKGSIITRDEAITNSGVVVTVW
jgi:PIN domain nuclease of toxin-antitoxin system